MKLTDRERAENREALAGMTLPQRLDHIFEYYKFPLVLTLIAAVALGSVLYYRLTRKEALLYAILQTGHEDLVASIRAAAMKKGSFQEILTGVCRQIAVSHERRHPMFHMAFMLNRRTQNDSPEARAHCDQMKVNYENLIAALADVFRYGREEGVLRGGLSDDALASCILNLMHGVGHSKGDAVQRLSLEELVDLFCHGIMKS